MLVVRPVRLEDLEALMGLALCAGVGLTTLPPDRRLLKDRILRSMNALSAEPVKPGGESYLLVLDDLRSGTLAGTCGMVAKVGGFEPFYSYQLENTLHESTELGVRREIPTLHLVSNHSGPSEIGTLFLSAAFRGGGNGRLLSLSRFLFMADAPERFDDEVIAEMRGVLTVEGHCPFWESVGRHFFDMEFARADVLSAADKTFIADLMPKHPIYIPMLPFDVQRVIGEVHDETRPARRLLEQEGFKFGDHVDIFDAGPLLTARRGDIRTIRESHLATVKDIVSEVKTGGGPDTHLISNAKLAFRCCMGTLRVVGDDPTAVELPIEVALTLGLRVGDRVRYAGARAG